MINRQVAIPDGKPQPRCLALRLSDPFTSVKLAMERQFPLRLGLGTPWQGRTSAGANKGAGRIESEPSCLSVASGTVSEEQTAERDRDHRCSEFEWACCRAQRAAAGLQAHPGFGVIQFF